MFPESDQFPAHCLLSLMEVAGEIAFQVNPEGEILHASQRAAHVCGSDVPLVGSSLFELASLSDRHAMVAAFMQAAQSKEITRVNVRLAARTAWFELEMVASGSPVSAVMVTGRDISFRHEIEQRLRHIAVHDELTGLPNRALLTDRLHMAIAHAKRGKTGFTVVELDLDGFKKVNDALGHAIGDKLLQVAADRLRTLLRDGDTLARIGGDEFAAILPGLATDPEVQTIALRMISSMQQPFEIDGHALYLSTSVGAAIYPRHGDTDVKLLAHADAALYRAKETGKARCVIYNQIAFDQIEHDVSMEAAMFDAVRNGDFSLHYQPIVDAGTQQILGFEALMRWMRRDVGMVSPAQFIPMAEDNGLINLLGAWALKVACVQLKKFQEAAGRKLYVSVNVSPRQFRNDRFIEMVDDALRLSGLNGDQLMLEITEGILMSDPEHAEQMLTQIAARGVRIAVDDFGTGYSSLVYLKRFPIAALKIDRTFIKDLPGSVKDAAICNVVLSLARHLDLLTVAEGVENDQQLTYLSAQGCNLIQGFHTGRPMQPESVVEVLRTAAAALQH